MDDEKPDNVVNLIIAPDQLVEEDGPMNLTCPDCNNAYWLINTEGVIKCSYCEWEMGETDETF